MLTGIELFDEVVGDLTGRLVLCSSPPGGGKTALMAFCAARMLAAGKKATWFGCSRWNAWRDLPFSPYLDMMQRHSNVPIVASNMLVLSHSEFETGRIHGIAPGSAMFVDDIDSIGIMPQLGDRASALSSAAMILADVARSRNIMCFMSCGMRENRAAGGLRMVRGNMSVVGMADVALILDVPERRNGPPAINVRVVKNRMGNLNQTFVVDTMYANGSAGSGPQHLMDAMVFAAAFEPVASPEEKAELEMRRMVLRAMRSPEYPPAWVFEDHPGLFG